MRGPFSKRLLLQIGIINKPNASLYPELKYCDCLLLGLISQIWQSCFLINHLLRNLTFNRSAHCTQVSDQCPLGLLFHKTCSVRHFIRDIGVKESILAVLCPFDFISAIFKDKRTHIVPENNKRTLKCNTTSRTRQIIRCRVIPTLGDCK